MKKFKVQILDVHTNDILDGFEVEAKNWQEARILAHTLKIIQDDFNTFNYLVYSVCEEGTDDKHVFLNFIRESDKTNFIVLS